MSVELFLTQASDLRPHFTIPAVARSAGHPDEIARGMADAAAAALETEAASRGVSHPIFSLGCTTLLPGIAVPRFGGGRSGQPMRVVLAGTGTDVPDRKHADLAEVAHLACQHWAREHLRFVDPARHLAVELHVRNPGHLRSASLAVARAPLAASQYLGSEAIALLQTEEIRKRFPEVGDDCEARALAIEARLVVHLTVAFLDRHVHSARGYAARKEELAHVVQERLRALPADFDTIEVLVNENDPPAREEDGCLLTVLGTTADGRRAGSADAAPEGETTSSNAAQFASALVARIRGVRAAVVRLEEDDHGEIRRAFVRLELQPGSTLEAVRGAVLELVPLRTHPARSADPDFS